MHIIKRNGTPVPVDLSKIQKRIDKGIEHLELKGVDISGIDAVELSIEAVNGLTEMITATEMDEHIAALCASKVTYDSGYMYLAGYILHTSIIKDVYTRLNVSDTVGGLYKLCDLGILSNEFRIKMNTLINADTWIMDTLNEIAYYESVPLTYFSVKTFEKTYLLKKDYQLVETPAMCRLRACVNLSSNYIELIDNFDSITKHMFTPATPILMNSGKPIQNLASCFLMQNESDSFQGIMSTFNEAMGVSRLAGGNGIHLHNIRAKGTEITSAGEPASGMIPLLRQYSAGLKTWNQSGKRMGSAAFYLEPWHADIRDFINAANPHSPLSVRVDELFYALWVPDLFMEAVKNDNDWYLFCPTKLERAGFRPLQSLWGEDFNKEYQLAVQAGVYNEKVKARDIWNLMLETQVTSGKPYVCFKDNANANNKQNQMGTLQGSNLCAEIYEYTSSEHSAVCNLGSITAHQNMSSSNLTSCWGKVNLYEKLKESAYRLAGMLNNAIDSTHYVSDKMEKSNKLLRPIAIGVQGMAELLIKLGLPYDSDEAMDIQENVIKAIYEGASKYNNDRTSNNSLLVALMPTASTSQILNNTESFEPLSGIVYKRNTNSGEFTVLQPQLIYDLKQLGLWDKDMRKLLINNPDSIQHIESIPLEIREKFKTVWDVPISKHVEASIRRQKWVDQGQSMNLYMPELDKQTLTKALFQGWRGGLKTGLYYLRSKSAGKKRNIT